MKGVKETVSLTYLYQHHLAFRFTFKHMVTFLEKNGKELGRILPSQWRAWPWENRVHTDFSRILYITFFPRSRTPWIHGAARQEQLLWVSSIKSCKLKLALIKAFLFWHSDYELSLWSDLACSFNDKGRASEVGWWVGIEPFRYVGAEFSFSCLICHLIVRFTKLCRRMPLLLSESDIGY